jgi:hypothetical protein
MKYHNYTINNYTFQDFITFLTQSYSEWFQCYTLSQPDLYIWLSIREFRSRCATGGGEEMCAEYLWETSHKTDIWKAKDKVGE